MPEQQPQPLPQYIPPGPSVNYGSGQPIPGILVSSFDTNSLSGPSPLPTPQIVGDNVQQPVQPPVFTPLETIPAGVQSTTPNPYRVEVRGQNGSGSLQVEYLPATNIDTQNPSDSNSQESVTGTATANQVITEDRNFLPSPQIVSFSPHLSTVVDHHAGINNGFQQTEQQQESDDQMQISGALTDDAIVSTPSRPQTVGNGNWEIIPAKQYDISYLFNGQKSNALPSTAPSQQTFSAQYGSPSSQQEVTVQQVSPTAFQGYSQSQGAQTGPEVNLAPIIDQTETQQQQNNDDGLGDSVSAESTGSAGPSSQEASEEIYTAEQAQTQHFPTAPENVAPTADQQNQLTGESPIQETPTNLPNTAPATVEGPISVDIPIVQNLDGAQQQQEQQTAQFDPMPPAVVNALQHAQRTSFLTHTHLGDDSSQSGMVYVESVPVVQDNSESNTNNNAEQVSQIQTIQTNVLETRENGIVVKNALRVDGATPGATFISPFNCSGGHMAFEVGDDGQTIVRAYPVKSHPGYYYPTPQSSVYWAEQPSSPSSQSNQLSQDANLQTKEGIQSSSSQTSYTTPVFGWSPQLVQTSNAVAAESSNQIQQSQQPTYSPIVTASVASLETSSAGQSLSSGSTESLGK